MGIKMYIFQLCFTQTHTRIEKAKYFTIKIVHWIALFSWARTKALKKHNTCNIEIHKIGENY